MFVLTLPRSGSTLLRYLLDAHPQMVCPPETELVALCQRMMGCWLGHEAATDPKRRLQVAKREARRAAKAFISWHLAESGKQVFCEKSLSNGELAPMLADLFPKAKFLCLYRHPMDFIASAIDSCRWGYSAFGLYPYAVSSVDNFVAGLARAWSERTAAILGFEEQFGDRCLRIRYEELVVETGAAYKGICAFCGVDFEEEAIETAFMQHHLGGHGDHQIGLASAVSTDSIGRGSEVPVGMIPPVGIVQINRQLELLGYPPLDYEWNGRPNPLRVRLATSDQTRHLQEILGSRVAAGVARLVGRPDVPQTGTIALVVDELADERCWVLDFATGEVSVEAPLPAVPLRLPGC